MSSPAQRPVLTYTTADGAHSFLLDRPVVAIGRHPDQDLVLADTFVSRRHAVIRETNAGHEIEDLASSHGTYLNGVRVRNASLHSGDTLQFGSPAAMKLRYHASSVGDSSSADDLLSTLGQISTRESTRAGEMGQLNFLLDAARRLNAGSATRDILHALLQLSIQLTGVERGFVFLRDAEPASHQDHASLSLGLGLSADGEFLHEDSTISRSAIRHAIENSSKFTVSDTRSDVAPTPFESVLAHSIRSIYCIPLRRRAAAAEAPYAQDRNYAPQTEQLLGVLYLDSRLSAGRINTLDNELLDTIATEAATLLDNALLAETELKARKAAEELAIAARIHAGLMPASLPGTPFVSLQARTVPCREIGGDFYDAIALPDALGIVIADVSGKGVPAAIVAATLQGIIHSQMLTGQPLDAIAALVNGFLCNRNVGKYATLVMMKLYPSGRLEYINCGHLRPLRVSPASAAPLLEANLIVGLLPEATYAFTEIQLNPGERILLATDGISEAENMSEEPFGEERLLAAASLEQIDDILNRVVEFQGAALAQDDCTLVNLCYTGAQI